MSMGFSMSSRRKEILRCNIRFKFYPGLFFLTTTIFQPLFLFLLDIKQAQNTTNRILQDIQGHRFSYTRSSSMWLGKKNQNLTPFVTSKHTFFQTQRPIPPSSLVLYQSQTCQLGCWVMMIKTSQV